MSIEKQMLNAFKHACLLYEGTPVVWSLFSGERARLLVFDRDTRKIVYRSKWCDDVSTCFKNFNRKKVKRARKSA